MEKLYAMKQAQEILGVSLKTLQRWDRNGQIRVVRTPGGRRRIPESEMKRILGEHSLPAPERVLVVYGQVSSHDQNIKGDLDRQIELVKGRFAKAEFKEIRVITDVSSGLNDRRKGLMRLMNMAKQKQVTDVAVSYKDRLTRFGFNYLQTFFESHGVTLHVVETKKDQKSVHQELVDDLISIIASFSGRLYGLQSKKSQELQNDLKEVIVKHEADPSRFQDGNEPE